MESKASLREEKMKKLTALFTLVACVCLFGLISASDPGSQDQEFGLGEYVPNEVLVRFKRETAPELIKSAIGSVHARIITNSGREIITSDWEPASLSTRSFLLDHYTFHLLVSDEIGTIGALAVLKTNPIIEYAEKNSISYLYVDPNDTHFGQLWGMKNHGQTGGTPDADIDAPEAWNIFTGSPDTVVAIIDTGIDYNHLDLQGNIWINTDEIPANDIDDDGNSFIDDYRGWNFVSNNNNPMDDSYPVYHGTHVAGTIGATGNNSEGVVGVNWTVKLMAIKAANSLGQLTDANIAHAIEYAIINGARVTNNSYGGHSYSQTVSNAIWLAKAEGQLFVAAAGNYPQISERDNDKTPVYPAGYSIGNIVSVLATDQFDGLPTYSHYGKTSVDLGAPGGTNNPSYPAGNILSTSGGNGYQSLHGTSMATPHVTGVAALALGKCPPMSCTQLRERLLSKVDVLGSLTNKCVSNGRLNAYKVVFDPAPPNAPTGLSAAPTGWNTISLSWLDNSSSELGFELQRKKEGESEYIHLLSVNPNTMATVDSDAAAGIIHFYRLRAYNMAGISAFTSEMSAVIPTGAPYEPLNPSATWDWTRSAVHITWDDYCANEQFFIVERKADWETEWQAVAELNQNCEFCYDEDVLGDRYYYYRIKATNPNGYSYSDQVYMYVPGWRAPFFWN
jgi:subtilisin family serine protease